MAGKRGLLGVLTFGRSFLKFIKAYHSPQKRQNVIRLTVCAFYVYLVFLSFPVGAVTSERDETSTLLPQERTDIKTPSRETSSAESTKLSLPKSAIDAVSAASTSLYPNRPFRIGVIELSDIHRIDWLRERTFNRLRAAFAPYQIDIVTLSSEKLEKAVKEKSVDAFIASSGFYWRMVPYGVRDVATMITRNRPDPNHTSAIAYITRSDNTRIQTIADMKGTVLSASYPTAFMGYRIGLAEIAAEGFDPEHFFSRVTFTQSPVIEAIAKKVLQGEADVAFVQSCWLERLPEAVRSQFRVIAPRQDTNFACARSTETYPNITVAVLKSAPPGAAREIARVLLTMPADENGERWGLATDFQSVDRVYRLLKLEQYSYLREWSVKRWIDAHRPWIAAGFFCVILLILHSFIVSLLVHLKTKELARATQEKEMAQRHLATLHARMENIRKASIVSQLSNLIAHELAQPVGAARSFCDGLKLLVENKTLTPEKLGVCIRGLDRVLGRTQGIVEKVRSYSRGDVSRDSRLRLASILKTARDSLSQLLVENVSITIDVANNIEILGDQLEMELLFNNLLANAAAASRAGSNPFVRVTVSDMSAASADAACGRVTVKIENTGRDMTDEDMMQLTVPFVSVTGPGHGLGVPISLSLAEANGGRLRFEKRSGGGVIAWATLRRTW